MFTWSRVTELDGILLPTQNDWDKARLVGLHARRPAITTTFVWHYTTWHDAHKTLISGARVSVSRWRDQPIGLNIKLLKARDLWEDICVICVIPARRHCCFLASLTGQSSRLAVRTAQKHLHRVDVYLLITGSFKNRSAPQLCTPRKEKQKRCTIHMWCCRIIGLVSHKSQLIRLPRSHHSPTAGSHFYCFYLSSVQ